MLYVLIADNTFDQVCETLEQATKEKRDLVNMGFKVKIKTFNTWEEVYKFEEAMVS